MGTLPMLTARQVIRALEKAGFQVQRQTGSHVHLKHVDGRVVDFETIKRTKVKSTPHELAVVHAVSSSARTAVR